MYGMVNTAIGDAASAVSGAQTAKAAVDVIVAQIQALADAANSGGDTAADNSNAQNAANLAANSATEAATQAANALTKLGDINSHVQEIDAKADLAEGHKASAQIANGKAST